MKDRKWRINNLYWIKNEEGDRIPFRMNWAQELLFDNLWYLNVVLKVRQLGVTTFFCIFYLDGVVFDGKDAGLIAHTLDDAKKIFDTKVRYAWDNLPESIRREYEVDANNTRELKFRRGKIESSIYVGTSLRSGTVQLLHVSEVSTLDQKYPERAEEIRTGALNTVHIGQLISVESTAKVPTGVFYDVCELGMTTKKMGRALGKLDWKFFFLPWWKHPQYQLAGEYVIPPDLQEYFRKLEAELGIKLEQTRRNWYFKKKQTQKEKMWSEYPSTPAEAFAVAIKGAYYEKEMTRVMETKRIARVPWIPTVPVDTYWDLGTSKQRKAATSILFVQDIGLEVHIIDFYGNTGEGLGHYKNVMTDRGYTYGRHYAPHDIKVKEFGSGKTRLEMGAKVGLQFEVIEKAAFADGIEASRMIFPMCWFDEEKCHDLIRAMRAYRREWDENLRRFKDYPLKDWASDPADAFRMMAVSHKDHIKLGFYDAEEEEMRKIREDEQARGEVDALNPLGM